MDDFTVPIRQMTLGQDTLSSLNLPERYQPLEVIGGGGMGFVVKAHDRELETVVAIKVLNEDLSGNTEQLQRFLREAKTLAQLVHDGILQIKSFGVTTEGRPYQVSEYLSGDTLAQKMAAGPLKPGEFKTIILQIAEALQYASSKGIVHRDIKPSNIMLVRGADNELVAKVLDFGIARVEDESGNSATKNLTGTSVALGSPAYMSPEQCRGVKVSFLSDIYSLGCVMYECLAGSPPFKGESPLETMYMHANQPAPPITSKDETVARLAELVYRCLSKNPQSRPQSYDEIKNEVTTCLNDVDETIALSALALKGEQKRRTLPLGWAAWLILPAVVGLCGAVWMLNRPQTPLQSAAQDPAQFRLQKAIDSLAEKERLANAEATSHLRLAALRQLYPAYISLGKDLLRFDLPKAEFYFSKAAALTPFQPGAERLYGYAKMKVGEAQLKQRKIGEAELTLKEAIRALDLAQDDRIEDKLYICEERVQARVNLAVVNSAGGNFKAGKRLFDECSPIVAQLFEYGELTAGKSLMPTLAFNQTMADHKLLEKFAQVKTPQDALDLAEMHLCGLRCMARVYKPTMHRSEPDELLKLTQSLLDKSAAANLPEWSRVNAETQHYRELFTNKSNRKGTFGEVN